MNTQKIIITTEAKRKSLIREFNGDSFLNKSFITYSEFYKNIFNQLDKRSIVKLMELHEELSYQKAKKIVDCLKYYGVFGTLDDEELNEYYNDLLQSGMINKNSDYKQLFLNKEIIVDYDVNSDIIEKFFNINKINYSIEQQNVSLQNKGYLEFSNAFEELSYVYNEIGNLIKNGTDINRIFIYGLSEEYRTHITYLNKMFGFDIDFPLQSSFIANRIGKDVLIELRIRDFDDAYASLMGKYSKNKQVSKSITKIFSHLINFKSELFTSEKQMAVYKSALKDFISISLPRTNAVRVISDFNYNKDDIVFVMNFNQDVYPKVSKNVSYLTIKKLREISAFTFEETNEIERKTVLSFLSNSNIKLITRKRRGSDGKNYISSIAKDYNFKIIQNSLQKVQFSNDCLNLNYASILDLNRKYRYIHDFYKTFKNTINIPYFEYDSNFKPFDLMDGRIGRYLSYTKVNTYFSCPFKYYLDYILVKENEETFDSVLGKFAHEFFKEVIASGDLSEENVSLIYETLFRKYDFSYNEQYALDRIRMDLISLIVFNASHEENFDIMPILNVEKEIRMNMNGIQIDGFVDKFYSFECEDGDFLAVVDYKSSSKSFDLKKIEYGGSLQLPTYLMLLRSTDEFKDAKFVGAFYQPFLSDSNVLPTMGEKYLSKFKLDGIMSNETDVLRLIDPDLSGDFVVSLKMNKEGTGVNIPEKSKGRFFGEEDFDNLIEKTKEQYRKASIAISQYKFDITPVKLGSDRSPCSYCKNKNICYATKANIKEINLGEDEDEQD